jgi:hypothetical protein
VTRSPLLVLLLANGSSSESSRLFTPGSRQRGLDSHQFADVFGLAAERTGTVRDTDRSGERCCSEELGNAPSLASRKTAPSGLSVDKSRPTTKKKYQSQTRKLIANIAAPATMQRSQLERLLLLAWSLFSRSTGNVSLKFGSAIQLLEYGG